MFTFLLEMLRHILTLFFGVFLSSFFLDIEKTKKNIFLLIGFSLVLLTIQGILYITRDVSFIMSLYPLISHLPLLLLFLFCFKRRLLPTVCAITTAYLCCQIANWCSIIPLTLGTEDWVVHLTYSVVLIITFVLVFLYLSPSLTNLYSKPMASLFLFAIMPCLYYVFDYLFTIYSDLLYQYNMLVVEFMPFMLSICYMLFCTVYFKQYEEKMEIKHHNHLMQMQGSHIEKEIKAIKRSEQAVALLRHDMRHFLGTISDYIESGQIEYAKSYINEIISLTDGTKQKKYCANYTINMILSYYAETMVEQKIQFVHNLKIPSQLGISDVDITAILSNGLENAVHAVLLLPPEKRIIELVMSEKNGKLLLSIENTYAKIPIIKDGKPISTEKNHGLGTQSIQYTVEKLNGHCQFSIINHRFVLQVII